MLELCKTLKLETVLWFFWKKTDLSCQRQKPSSILADPKILLQFRTFRILFLFRKLVFQNRISIRKQIFVFIEKF